ALQHGARVVRRGHDDGALQPEALDESALRAQTPRTRVDDLDAHDAPLTGLREQAADLPARDAEERADLVLRLVLVVRKLGDADHQQLVIHGILLRIQLRSPPTSAHADAHMSSAPLNRRASAGPDAEERPGLIRTALLDVSSGDALARGQPLVDDAVLLGLLGGEDVVTIDVAVDLLDRLAGVTGHGLLEPGAHPKDLAGLDLDVGRLSLAGLAHRRLVHEH